MRSSREREREREGKRVGERRREREGEGEREHARRVMSILVDWVKVVEGEIEEFKKERERE